MSARSDKKSYGQKRMPKYEIIGILSAILAHNLAKYHYFSMKPTLFDKYYQITYSLRFLVQYHVKCGFYGQNPQKCHFLDSQFFKSAPHVLANNSGCDKYFYKKKFRGVIEPDF